MLASTEFVVHRAIYQATAGLAIVHTHPPYAVTLSLVADEIVPVDTEGSYLLHKMPVVAAELTAGSTEVAELVSRWLKEYDLVMLRGHGPFAIGHLLEEAYQLTSVLEKACRILTISEGRAAEGKSTARAATTTGLVGGGLARRRRPRAAATCARSRGARRRPGRAPGSRPRRARSRRPSTWASASASWSAWALPRLPRA